MPTHKTATHNGRQYRSRVEVARELAQITGRPVHYFEGIVGKHNGDGDAALRWWQTHHRKHHPKRVINFEGRAMTRQALARELAPQLALSVHAIAQRLYVNGDDVEQLRRDVEQKRRDAEKQRIVVNGTTYPHRAAFVHDMHRRYRPVPRTVWRWIKQEGLEATLIHARAYARQRRKHAQQRRDIELPVILFGWQFRSFSAMCRYYEISHNVRKAEWENHVLADKSPCLFSPIATKLAQWWEAAMLDDHMRSGAAAEAQMPKSRLPLNLEQLPITDPWEINFLKLQASARQRLETMVETARRAERDHQ
jgi:hypothetical protein